MHRNAGASFSDAPQLCHSAYGELKNFKAGSIIFVNSMSDTYHESVPVAWIHSIHNTAAAHPDKVFLLLTKRPERALALSPHLAYPPNLWVGTSVESADYQWRLDYLLQIPAAGHFMSAEPLLEPLFDYAHYLYPEWAGNKWHNALKWVIVGGESGKDRRHFDTNWVRSIRDTCAAAGVPFMYKQGSHFRSEQDRILDGRTHDDFPDFFNRGQSPAAETRYAYVAYKPCGCLVCATVDEPNRAKHTAKHLSQWVKAGYRIERVTTEFVRQHFVADCPHITKPAPLPMFPDL
jgi:protein gp37